MRENILKALENLILTQEPVSVEYIDMLILDSDFVTVI